MYTENINLFRKGVKLLGLFQASDEFTKSKGPSSIGWPFDNVKALDKSKLTLIVVALELGLDPLHSIVKAQKVNIHIQALVVYGEQGFIWQSFVGILTEDKLVVRSTPLPLDLIFHPSHSRPHTTKIQIDIKILVVDVEKLDTLLRDILGDTLGHCYAL